MKHSEVLEIIAQGIEVVAVNLEEVDEKSIARSVFILGCLYTRCHALKYEMEFMEENKKDD